MEQETILAFCVYGFYTCLIFDIKKNIDVGQMYDCFGYRQNY